MLSPRTSFIYSLASTYSTTAISLVSSMILARLLSPEQIGVFSVTASLVMVAHALREFGVGSYLVQEHELTPERTQSAFGVALLIAWLIAIVIYNGRTAAADFYGEPGVAEILQILAINFALIPFGSVNIALLGRKMQFDVLLRIDLAGLLVNTLTSIMLALLGHGFMSLAWAALAGTATTVLMSVYYRSDELRWFPSLAQWRRVAGSSSLYSAGAILAKLDLGATDLIIGRTLGFASVGLFSRANGLFLMFSDKLVRSVRVVVECELARRRRANVAITSDYLRSISYLTAIAWSLYAFFAATAVPLIEFLFGSQWENAARLVPIIALAAACTTLAELAPSVLTALGKPRLFLRSQALSLTVTVIAITIASSFDLTAVAWALVLARIARSIVFHRIIAPLLGYNFRDLCKYTIPSLFVAVACYSATALIIISPTLSGSNRFIQLVASSFACSLAWITAVILIRHPIRSEVLTALNKGMTMTAKK